MQTTIELERELLRHVLQKPFVLQSIDWLRPDDFIGTAEARCFKAIQKLYQKTERITPQYLHAEMGVLGEIFLQHLAATATNTKEEHLDYAVIRLAQEILEAKNRRMIIPLLYRALEDLDRGEKVMEVFETLEMETWKVLRETSRQTSPSVRSVLYGALHQLEEMYQDDAACIGWDGLDQLVGWWPERAVTLITVPEAFDVGRFASSLVCTALDSHSRTLLLDEVRSKEAVTVSLLAALAGFPLNRDIADAPRWNELTSVATHLNQAPLFLADPLDSIAYLKNNDFSDADLFIAVLHPDGVEEKIRSYERLAKCLGKRVILLVTDGLDSQTGMRVHTWLRVAPRGEDEVSIRIVQDHLGRRGEATLQLSQPIEELGKMWRKREPEEEISSQK